MTERYAIYYAPKPDSRFWDKASAWLGYDASSREVIARRSLPGLEDLDLDILTAEPNGYGFHATLKAPFEMATWRSEAELLDQVRRTAAQLPAFEAPIGPAALGRFLAFQLQSPSPEMNALHALCVREFDGFRAPLSEADLARRRKRPLTPEQDAQLLEWGYPYVFDDFRFHMTLTSAISDDVVRARVLAVLEDYFAEETGAHRFDGLAVFKQDDRQAPFHILERYAFKGRESA